MAIGGVGDAVRKFLRKLAGDSGDEFGDVTVQTIRSVASGVIGEAFVLALLHGILFLLAGVPYAGLWALLIFVLAVVSDACVPGNGACNDLLFFREGNSECNTMDNITVAG